MVASITSSVSCGGALEPATITRAPWPARPSGSSWCAGGRRYRRSPRRPASRADRVVGDRAGSPPRSPPTNLGADAARPTTSSCSSAAARNVSRGADSDRAPPCSRRLLRRACRWSSSCRRRSRRRPGSPSGGRRVRRRQHAEERGDLLGERHPRRSPEAWRASSRTHELAVAFTPTSAPISASSSRSHEAESPGRRP